jgi:GNAT superfamily N-acetyltransferase
MSADLGAFPMSIDFRAFLAIGPDARLRGCVVAHPISSAYLAEFAADVSAASPARCNDAGNAVPDLDDGGSRTHARTECLRRGESPVPAACGVSHIWVSLEHRRHGVGILLLEAVRRHMASSFQLTRAQVAFCQPTEGGRSLALAFLGKEAPLLVYDDAGEVRGQGVASAEGIRGRRKGAAEVKDV